ncbi:MAG: GNAT family N-acetyltransferase [Thermoleophilia bacterium]|jgi:RimJ/RimL family protein N-acetyltransferase|nr:GNAT family N-acetyltransferase [Thermoleophilia bacterium]
MAELPDRPLSDGVVTLTVSGPADAADVAAAVPAGEPGAWEATPGPYTAEQAQRILGAWEKARRLGSRVAFTARDAGDGRYLGAVVLMSGTPERPQDDAARAEFEVAWWVAPSERRRGVAARAVALVAAWARHAPGVDLLWAEIGPANEASRRVALANGFVGGERLRRDTGAVTVFRLRTSA